MKEKISVTFNDVGTEERKVDTSEGMQQPNGTKSVVKPSMTIPTGFLNDLPGICIFFL